jgi:hypothetical protein
MLERVPMCRALLLWVLVVAPGAWAQGASANTSVPPPPDAPLVPPLVRAPAEPEPEPEPIAVPEFMPRALVLKQGEWVRVELKGAPESQSGELVSLKPGALSLRTSHEEVLNLVLTDVLLLETRKRAVGHGTSRWEVRWR